MSKREIELFIFEDHKYLPFLIQAFQKLTHA